MYMYVHVLLCSPICSKCRSGWPPLVSLSGFTAGSERLVVMQAYIMYMYYVHVHVTILTSTKLSSETVDSHATYFLFQQSVFLLHNEEEREDWISAIKKLQPKGKSL
jgi:hypothetical protein